MHVWDGHVTWTVGRDLGILNTITKYRTFEPRIQLRTSCLPFVFTNCGPTTMMAKTTLKTMQSAPSLILLSSSPIQMRFCPVLMPESSPVSTLLGTSSPQFASLPISPHIEVSATSFQTARKLSMLISQGAGGSALVIDYGTDHAVGNSFRVRVSFPLACYHFFTSDSMRSCVCVGIQGPRPRQPI
jgi:hypothetical protein